MKTTISRVIFIVIMTTVFSYVIFYNLLYSHELAHAKIFSYNGVDSEVKIDMWLNGETIPTSEIPDDRRDLIYLGHAINEVVGYQNDVIVMVLLVNTMILLILVTQK